MTKPASRRSVREEKAAALDDLVKAELARMKVVNQAKAAKLKALRLARDEADAALEEDKSAISKTLHLPRRS